MTIRSCVSSRVAPSPWYRPYAPRRRPPSEITTATCASALRNRSGRSSSASRTSSSKSESLSGSSAMKSCSSGSTTRPSRARRSEERTISSNSLSDSGSFQPAIRTATKATLPISAAATITPSATSSSARTAPMELKPWPMTSRIRPTDMGTSAATPIRLGGEDPGGWMLRITGELAFLFQRAGDDETLDLVGALVYLGDLGISHHALDWVLLDVTVAAQHLHGLDGDGHGAGLVQQLTRGGGACFHVGELELDSLELIDGLAELAALAGVADGVVG